jgi:two-component system, NtrC family, response regulator AtoC
MRLSRTTLITGGIVAVTISLAFVSRRVLMDLIAYRSELARLLPVATDRMSWCIALSGQLFGVLRGSPAAELWRTAGMGEVRRLIERVARSGVTAVITGESGVGKEVVARTIHAASARRDQPFVKVNCAALPGELLEAELFGHERGAFTGAHTQRRGKFELAHGGTLLLDEITDLPIDLQARLLHVLQDGQFYRIGGTQPITVDVQVLATTHRDLEAAVEAGEFRRDLYYRLHVIQIHVRPLRERREEIPALVERFRQEFNEGYGRTIEFPPETLRALGDYEWPGNVRELRNTIERMIVLGEVRPYLPGRDVRSLPEVTDGVANGHALERPRSLKEISREAARAVERAVVEDVLRRAAGNRVRAAEMLRMSSRSLRDKLSELGLLRAEGRVEKSA